MKTKQILLKTFMLFLILIIPGTASLARGTAAIMGNLQTVSTDGPFDAIRNPAAMAFGGTSAGINFFFSPWSGDKTEETVKNISVIQGGTPLTIDSTQYDPSLDKKTVLTQTFATTISLSDMFSLGLGITSFFKDQENSILQSFTVLPSTMGMDINSRSKDTVYNTYFSLGVQLTKTISMGYSLNFSIGNEENDAESVGFTKIGAAATVYDTPSYSHNSIGNISGEISAYFMHKTGAHQTGINLYSGTYSWIDFSAEGGGMSFDTDFAGSYSKGASLMAGHYWRFSPFIAAAFETGITIPTKFTPYSYNSTAPTFSDKQIKLEGLTILASAGVEINPLKKLTTGFGLTYINTRGGTRSITSASGYLEDSTTNYQVHAVNTTAGLTYEIFAGMEVNFTTNFIWLGVSAEKETLQSSGDLFVYTIATETNSFQIDFSFSFVKKI